jgi:Tfp pilus assembly protein PilV
MNPTRYFDRVRATKVEKGYALLETFIALVILAFALAGLVMLMVGNVKAGFDARRFTAASALAQQKLEDLRAAGYAAAASSTSNETLSETGTTSGVRPFTRSWTVANGALAGTKNVSIVVAWGDQQGSHQVQLSSLFSQ